MTVVSQKSITNKDPAATSLSHFISSCLQMCEYCPPYQILKSTHEAINLLWCNGSTSFRSYEPFCWWLWKKMKLEVLDQESLGKTHILCSKEFTKQTTYFRVPNGCPPPRPVLSPTAIIFKNIFQQRRIRTLTSICDGALWKYD